MRFVWAVMEVEVAGMLEAPVQWTAHPLIVGEIYSQLLAVILMERKDSNHPV